MMSTDIVINQCGSRINATRNLGEDDVPPRRGSPTFLSSPRPDGLGYALSRPRALDATSPRARSLFYW
jgi:hypothetical protein